MTFIQNKRKKILFRHAFFLSKTSYATDGVLDITTTSTRHLPTYKQLVAKLQNE